MLPCFADMMVECTSLMIDDELNVINNQPSTERRESSDECVNQSERDTALRHDSSMTSESGTDSEYDTDDMDTVSDPEYTEAAIFVRLD